MAVTFSDALARIIWDSGYDAWANAGILEGRSGPPPGPGLAPTGTLLVSITLPADAFAAASGRSKAKQGTWEGLGVAVGVLGHYRLKASGDTGAVTQNEPRQEGTITATLGGGDMTVSDVNVTIGGTVTVVTFSGSL